MRKHGEEMCPHECCGFMLGSALDGTQRITEIRSNPEEAQISRIEGSILIPLGELPERVAELDTAQQMVVHCRMGGRSAKAVEFLRSVGFRKVKNLVGGINAWAEDVDTSLAKY